MIWFDFLNDKGYFAPESNPAPLTEKGGATIPLWDSLTYLSKLSLKIKEGKYPEYADKIIKVITDVSKAPQDNHRTWYTFINILGNLQNENISLDILMYIPTWLDSRYDTTLQTSGICEVLLPKFLKDSPTPEDVSKAECILKQLFSIHEYPLEEEQYPSGRDNSFCYSRVHLYFLKTSLVDKGLIPRIIANCSDDVILFLARNLKRILLNSPAIEGVLKSDPEEYLVRLTISGDNLVISSRKGNEAPVQRFVINEYEQLETDSLLKSIREVVAADDVHEINETKLVSLVERLSIDFNSLYLREDIAEVGDESSGRDDLQHVFAFILQRLIREKAKQDPEGSVKIFKKLLYDKKYRIAYFKRLVLDAIAENSTVEMREAFWRMVNVKDEQYFIDDKYEDEVLRVLKAHASSFAIDEVDRLNQILKSKDSLTDDKNALYWKFRMLAALKENNAFSSAYETLSSELNLTSNDLEHAGNIAIAHDFESPYTALEIQDMPANEIVKAIETFHPDRTWRGPSIEGFGKALEKAVSESPDRFSKHLDLFDKLPYTYVYHILEGFRESWKSKKQFSWKGLLSFCNRYVLNPEFGTEKLKLEQDGWHSHEFIVGTIGYLITDGTHSDENSFDPQYLPIAKELIIKLVPTLRSRNLFKDSSMDYVTYVINSSSGKTLRALLDYSLRVSRITNKNLSVGSWDSELKALFELSLHRKMLDAYILTGMYYQQFYYLDAEWMSKTFKAFYKLEDELWHGFMGGLFFANAPFNKDVFEVASFHYQRAIGDEALNEKSLHETNMATHIGVFYLRGYCDLNSKNVITDFLINSHPNHLDKLLGFLRVQLQHLRKLEVTEWKRYASLVVDLWEYLITMYEKNDQEEYQRVLSGLSGLIGYIDQLDERTVDMLVKTVRFTDRSFNTHQLVTALLELKDKGNNTDNARYLGQILNALNLNTYFPTVEKQILTLIEFAYQHDSKALADVFCHKLGIHGYTFQKDVFQKHNFL